MAVLPHFMDAVFSLSASSAQVWSALLVFHILLVRDLKHQIEHEIDTLWGDAKAWWPELILHLNDPRTLKPKLSEFGLSTDTVLRADTHKNSFIRLIAAIKTHQIFLAHFDRLDGKHDLSAQELQAKFEPIAERIQELEREHPSTREAFRIGIAGIGFNFISCAVGAFGFLKGDIHVLLTLGINLILLLFFGKEVKKALDHFNFTSQHDAISDQINDLENHREKRRIFTQNRNPLKRRA